MFINIVDITAECIIGLPILDENAPGVSFAVDRNENQYQILRREPTSEVIVN